MGQTCFVMADGDPDGQRPYLKSVLSKTPMIQKLDDGAELDDGDDSDDEARPGDGPNPDNGAERAWQDSDVFFFCLLFYLMLKLALNVLKRCLYVIKRCLCVIQRCLYVLKRCLHISKCLIDII